MKSLYHQFADWVGQQPADEEYAYHRTVGCALFVFLQASGLPVGSVGGVTWRDTKGQNHSIPNSVATALAESPRTFGALAERLKSS